MSPVSSILVVVTRRIGDVVLVSPLLHALGRRWPAAAIDMLVFPGTGGVLHGHPGVRTVIEVPERPSARAHLSLVLRIFGRYDVAFAAIPSDRAALYARLSGKVAFGVVPAGSKHAWKRALFRRSVEHSENEIHTVVQYLRLAELVGAEPAFDFHLPAEPLPESVSRSLSGRPYAVIHGWPRFRYKAWTPHGYAEVARWLERRGIRVVLTGSADPVELDMLRRMMGAMPPDTLNLAGCLSLAQTSRLIVDADLYVGPDTAITHLAAAAGVPTVAIYGPSSPVKWGPWPAGEAHDTSPWPMVGSRRCGNVFLVQGEAACEPRVPCLQEGCERHLESASVCLETLPASRVIQAAKTLLEQAGSTVRGLARSS